MSSRTSLSTRVGRIVILPTVALTALLSSCGPASRAAETTMLESTIQDLLARLPESIDAERRAELDRFAAELVLLGDRQDAAELPITFICTHNSRRSHLSQIWAQAAAHRFGLERVRTYSGGTEATAFNPRAVAAVERAGFHVERTADGGEDNPRYLVRVAPDTEPMRCWSKQFSDPLNPQADFVAVMTCTSADAACPHVPGASLRVALPYVDPKEADGTEREAAVYDERCAQIGREMLYLFERVAAQRDAAASD